MDKIAKIVDLLRTLIQQCYTGHITIHFNKGCLCKIEKRETLSI